jgi:hypothetical protein
MMIDIIVEFQSQKKTELSLFVEIKWNKIV